MPNRTVTVNMSNKTYDTLKLIALVFLPGLATLYFALSQIWGFPHGEEVMGTITAIDIFLGSILKVSSNTYNNPENDELTHEVEQS